MDFTSYLAAQFAIWVVILICIGLVLGAVLFLGMPWLWHYLGAHLHWVA